MYMILDILLLTGGYVGSIYSWPWLRTKLQGIEAEVKALEARAEALKAAISGK